MREGIACLPRVPELPCPLVEEIDTGTWTRDEGPNVTPFGTTSLGPHTCCQETCSSAAKHPVPSPGLQVLSPPASNQPSLPHMSPSLHPVTQPLGPHMVPEATTCFWPLPSTCLCRCFSLCLACSCLLGHLIHLILQDAAGVTSSGKPSTNYSIFSVFRTLFC